MIGAGLDKIYFFVMKPEGGGIQRTFSRLAKAAHADGKSACMVCVNSPESGDHQREAEVEYLYLSKRSDVSGSNIVLIFILWVRFCLAESPKIVYTGHASLNFVCKFYNSIICRAFRYFHVSSIRTSFSSDLYNAKSGISRVIVKWFVGYGSFSDAIIANSIGTKESYVSNVSDRFSVADVVYNPICNEDLILLASEEIGAEVSSLIGSDDYFVFVGRLVDQKNVSMLIRAFHSCGLHHEYKLLIVGDGPERGSLLRITNELNIQERVLFVGYLQNPYPVIKSAKILCLPSKSEGFGNVIVEALALGVYVVATDCESGPSEIIKSEEYGMLSINNDLDSYADCMIRAAKKVVLGDILRDYAFGNFSVKASYDRHLQVFIRSLNSK